MSLQYTTKTAQTVQRSSTRPAPATRPTGSSQPASDLLTVQRHYGNRAAQQLLATHAIQAKLTVGAAHDRYEDEADRVGEAIMRTPDADTSINPADEEHLQRKPLAATLTPVIQRHRSRAPKAADEEREDRLDEEEEERAQGRVQRAATSNNEAAFQADDHFEQRLTQQRTGGTPLPDRLRNFMEPRFGANFERVRVHTGGEAAQLNHSIRAEAFTHGSNIYFAPGKYDPQTTHGQKLLAHELTHVVQQGGAGTQPVQTKRIQRKFSLTNWRKGRQNKQPTPINYSSLSNIRKGAHLPNTEKMAEHRMKQVMQYDEATIGDEFKKRAKTDGAALLDDESFVTTLKAKTQVADGWFDQVKPVIIKHLKGPDELKVALTNAKGELKITKGLDIKPLTNFIFEFENALTAYSKGKAQQSARGLRQEAEYANLPGYTQHEAFWESRQNVKMQQASVPDNERPQFASALKAMPTIKFLTTPNTHGGGFRQHVGWKDGGNLAEKVSFVKDVKVKGPLGTYLNDKRTRSRKIYRRVNKVDRLVRIIVEPELLATIPRPRIKAHTNGWLRAGEAGGEVNCTYDEASDVIAHEVGHALEEHISMDAWHDIHMLLGERHRAAGGGQTAKAGATPLLTTWSEGRYAGKWATGKYTSTAYTQDNAEVMSMWMQFMAKPANALHLVDEDPQHAALILRIVRPSEYAATGALRPFDKYLPQKTGPSVVDRYKAAQKKVNKLYGL